MNTLKEPQILLVRTFNSERSFSGLSAVSGLSVTVPPPRPISENHLPRSVLISGTVSIPPPILLFSLTVIVRQDIA